MVNLELYKIFYEVAKAENITKASNSLNISQPAVTKHIKNLEEQIGCPLFIRTKKGVILNETGKKIIPYIKQALDYFTLAEKEIYEEKELTTGTLHIGISTTLTKKYLLPIIEQYHKIYPNIIIEISTDPTSYLKKQLKMGLLDFIIAKMSQNKDYDLDYLELGSLQDIFVVSKDFQELINQNIDLKDLANYPILVQKQPSSSRDLVENYFSENNISLKSAMEIASSNLLIDFAKIGYGVGVVTKQYVQEELNQKNLFELNVTPKIKERKFGIIQLKNNQPSFSAKEFLKLIEKNNL